MPNEHADETTAQVIRAIAFPRYVTAVLVQMVAAHGVALGLGIIAGGDARMGGPSFYVAAAVAPALVWGLAYTVAGSTLALVAWRAPRRTLWAGAALALMHAFLAIALLCGVLTNPVAAMTGWVNYGGMAVVTTTVAWFTAWIGKEWPR